MAGLFLGLIIDLVLVHFKIHLLGGLLPFLTMAGITIPGIHKLKKSGWLEKNENKAVNNAKMRLEKRRQRLAERGVEWMIKKSEKNVKDVLTFGAYCMLGATALILLPKGSDIVDVIAALTIACTIGTLFMISKYFRFLVNKIMEPYIRDVNEGYLYYKS